MPSFTIGKMATTFSNVKHKNSFVYMEKIIFFKLVHEMSLFYYLFVWVSALFEPKQEEKSIKHNAVPNIWSGFQSDSLGVALASAVDYECLYERFLGKVGVLRESNISKRNELV